MRDFPGLNLDTDPRDIEAGAARQQVNLTIREGSLHVRRGLRPVTFDQTIDASP